MFIVIKDNEIVLADENKERLAKTLEFMPDYAGCEIVETDRRVEMIDNRFVYADTEEYNEWHKRNSDKERIAELKQMLADADYWTSKRVDGEYTDEEWAEKVAIRKAWRAEINELELVVDKKQESI